MAAVLSADKRHLIAMLRQSCVGLFILLDLVDDSVHARSECLLSGADDFWLSGSSPSDYLMRLRLRLHSTLSQRKPSRPLLFD